MKIRINNKQTKIKPASELTVKEYIELFDRLNEKSTEIDIFTNYVSIVTGYQVYTILKLNFDTHSFRRLTAYIGEIYAPKSFPELKTFTYLKTGEIFFQKKIEWRTLGIRKLLEAKKSDNQLELVVYLLSIIVSKDYDSDTIEEIYSELMDYRATDMYGFAVFFFKKLMSGSKHETNFLRLLLKKVSTNIQKLSNK